MSWGIDFNTAVFISHERDLKTVDQIQERVDDLSKEIENEKASLFALSASTPKDLFPNSEDILFDLKQRVENSFELIVENQTKITLLYLYLKSKTEEK